ncbi:MAG: RNA helicase, partial [candidate division SR1 bacterium]
DFYAIVFCKTKYTADTITASLIEKGYDAQALHGDIQQKQRERILKLFKNKKINILVATDVAARGIDVDNVSHVINYSLPQDPESYVHRVGRTGRAGNTGTAITFVSPQEYKGMMYVQRITNTEIKKAEIPEIDEIISTRKAKLKKTLDFITQGEGYKKFMPIAQELVESSDPVEVISALLKIHYQDVFDKEQYQRINKVNIDTTGKTRLFIALGRKDGFSPRSLVEHIQKETNVKQNLIDDVKVLEDFSFITVPFVDAEVIIKIFEKKRASGQRSLVSKAKDDRNSSRRGRSGRKNNDRNPRSRDRNSRKR